MNQDKKEDFKSSDESKPILRYSMGFTATHHFIAEAFSGWLGKTLRAFPAFEERNYRLYFRGQLVSLIGTWLQTVAQGWLVLELTHSAFWVGTIAALQTLPIFLFVLVGGAMVDRLPKLKVFLATQVAAMLLALILGVLTLAGVVTIWHVAVLAFLLGLVNAFDMPARQAMISIMITKKERLASAIALQAGLFNSSRVLGPAIAGILISFIGVGGTFLINAVSFGAVIASIFSMKIKEQIATSHLHPIRAVMRGLHYAFAIPSVRLVIIASALTSIFGWSYASLLPIIAGEVFHQGAAELGYLHTATGLGAVLTAIFASLYVSRIGPRYFIIGGNALFAASLLSLSFAPGFGTALVALFFTGLALTAQFSTSNSVIQHSIEDTMRGRVMSIYALSHLGMLPFGNFMMGNLAEYFGTPIAIRIGAITMMSVVLLLFIKRKTLPKRLHAGKVIVLTSSIQEK